MSTGSITSASLMCGLTGYNGLGLNSGFYGNYGMYGGYGMADGDVTLYQNNMGNSYDVWQTQNGYNSKPSVEAMTLNDQCQSIGLVLAEGRTDRASKEFNKLVSELKQYPQYANYNEREIKSVARSLYQNATGSDLLADIDTHASGSFVQGLKEGCAIVGLFANRSTKADLKEQITGVKKSKIDTLKETAGAMLSGAATYGVAGLAISAGNPFGAGVGALIGAGIGLLKSITPSVIEK